MFQMYKPSKASKKGGSFLQEVLITVRQPRVSISLGSSYGIHTGETGRRGAQLWAQARPKSADPIKTR